MKINDLDLQKLKKYLGVLPSNWIEEIRIMHNNECDENCILNINGKSINLSEVDYFEGEEIEDGILKNLYAWKFKDPEELLEKDLVFKLNKIDFSNYIVV
jgi:hypothetical protein